MSILGLQRTAGNRTVAAVLASATSGPPTIRRQPGDGYYVVCSSTAQGATLIDNDKAVPKRHYRTVASLSSQATKAPLQPFYVWSLYDDPAADAQPSPVEPEEEPPVVVKPTPKSKSTPPKGSGPLTVTTPPKSTTPLTGTTTPKGKKKSAKEDTSSQTAEKPGAVKKPPVSTPKADPGIPGEEPWKTVYRQTFKWSGDPAGKKRAVQGDIDGIEMRLSDKKATFDKSLLELERVWVPELDSVGLPERQEAFRTQMALNWTGNAATAQKHLDALSAVQKDVDAHIAKCKADIAAKKAVADLAQAIAELEIALTPERLATMTTLMSESDTVKYADTVGRGRLKELLVTRQIPAAALVRYGAPMMKTFVGAGPLMWTHLKDVKLNSDKAVSGGHDEDVFLKFIGKNGYIVLSDDPDPNVLSPPRNPASVYKVRYGTCTINNQKVDTDEEADDGTIQTVTSTVRVKTNHVVGSKTLIRNLIKDKTMWMEAFKDAVWRAVADQRLTGGSFSATDADNWNYSGFYTMGEPEVSSMWPEIAG